APSGRARRRSPPIRAPARPRCARQCAWRRLPVRRIPPSSACQGCPKSRVRKKGKSVFRTSDIIMLTVIVAATAFTYKVKHDTEARLSEIRKIEAQIRFEEDTIDVLKADWSLLTQPARLDKLSKVYEAELGLKTTDAKQIVRLSE